MNPFCSGFQKQEVFVQALLNFDCIYQEESITGAGERLNRTQSAISHALERLRNLFDDEFVCMVSSDHREIKDELTLEGYLANSHIIFAPSGKQDRLEKSLRKQGIKRRIVLQVPHILVIPQILKETPYLVTLPRKLAEALDVTFLRTLEPPLALPKIPVMQYWHEAMSHDPAHRWLRKMVHDAM